MKKFMVLNLTGKDRKGIVDEISKILFDEDANIENSHMETLGGCFSIMALFSFDDKRLESITNGLEIFKSMGFNIILHEAQDPSLLPEKNVTPLSIKIQAMDHPGIVQELVHLLHSFDVNIQSLDTYITNAPLSGGPLFHLSLKAEVQPETSVEVIISELDKKSIKMGFEMHYN
jgi:glycine cleavage system transcriptional repressor